MNEILQYIGNKVKPCPFCGGHKIYIDTPDFFETLAESHPEHAPRLGIECLDCNLEMHDYTDTTDYHARKIELIKKWNKRVNKEDNENA